MIEIPHYPGHLRFAVLNKNPYLENFYGFNFSSVSYMGAFAEVN